jgi:hypothetical protein
LPGFHCASAPHAGQENFCRAVASDMVVKLNQRRHWTASREIIFVIPIVVPSTVGFSSLQNRRLSRASSQYAHIPKRSDTQESEATAIVQPFRDSTSAGAAPARALLCGNCSRRSLNPSRRRRKVSCKRATTSRREDGLFPRLVRCLRAFQHSNRKAIAIGTGTPLAPEHSTCSFRPRQTHSNPTHKLAVHKPSVRRG